MSQAVRESSAGPVTARAGTPSIAPGSLWAPVLLVDDNSNKRLALRTVLEPLGFPIIEASSGEAALRCVLAQEFAAILLDVRMPGMDGFETAGLIRQRRQSEMTPIIFITGFAIDELGLANRYVEGAVDFIASPVPPEELRAKISVFANIFLKAERLASEAREVQTSADQLRLLTEAAPVGIFQTDEDFRYVYTNPRWSEITGVPAGTAVGRRWGSLRGCDSRPPSTHKPVAGIGPDELAQRFQIRRPDVTGRIGLVTCRPIPRPGGGTAGWVGTLADVTTEADAEVAMSAARDSADEASRLKSDFLANMSHEIRTPMNGVIGMTDLLLDTELDERQRDYALTVRNSGEALLTIVNDILDFSKIEAGQLSVEHVDFDPRSVLEDVVNLLTPLTRRKGLEITAIVDATVPAAVNGDPGRVRQVLTNLIGNATKFTHEGVIAVRVDATPGQDAGTTTDADTGIVVRFEIADTGDGIAADKLGAVFQPFVQADSSTSRKYGGTGLGLSISARLVSLMGGSCGVVSELGAGSTFWFTVDVQRTAAAPPARPVPAAADLANAIPAATVPAVNVPAVNVPAVKVPAVKVPAVKVPAATVPTVKVPAVKVPAVFELSGADLSGADLSGPDPARTSRGRLLLAEDNPINRKVAEAVLTKAGYQLDVVVNGAEAVRAVTGAPYLAVLMDCQMPEMDGYEATAAIRALPGPVSRIPIIAMTAGARQEDRDRCVAAGMNNYLSKPVSRDALLSLVARTVRSDVGGATD